jgi:pimeloyl-ACP methyl ester carboxylesterase
MLRILGWSGALIALAVLAVAGTRAIAQRRNARSLAIDVPPGIDESLFVHLGGVEQWVGIRGARRENPVVLVLHGGPGMSYGPLAPFFREWEPHFTVVQWDRRGVGRTYGRSGRSDSAAITFDRLAEDGIELAKWLRDRFGVERIVLVGHSVGSAVGILMIRKQPALFSAYVGTDQIVSMERNEAVSWQMLVDHSRARGDSATLSSLEKIGPPPYTNVDRWFAKQRLISATDSSAPGFENTLFKTAIAAPGYSLNDLQHWGAGLKFSASAMLAEMMSLEVTPSGEQFAVPVFLIEGEDDRIDPTRLATEWFATIEAPRKELVIMRGAGHNAMMARQSEFVATLVRLLRSL